MWSALATRHAGLAICQGKARRYQPDIGPICDTPDESDASIADLGDLIARTGPVAVGHVPEVICPPGACVIGSGRYPQMLFDGAAPEIDDTIPIRRLGDAEAAAMCALAALTNPGPFAPRTHELGEYWGVFEGDHLVAMAGERMKQPGFSEISAVCTHPEHIGRGYAGALCRLLLNHILARGEQPYLHVHGENARAVGLYESLGFRQRAVMNVAFMKPV